MIAFQNSVMLALSELEAVSDELGRENGFGRV